MIYTRVTTRALNDNIIQNLLVNRSKLNDLQEQISTGKKISKASQDASAALQIMNTRTSIEQTDNYVKNIEYASSEVDLTSSVIQKAIDTVQRAKELTVQAANGTNSTDQLQMISKEIDQLLQTVKDIGNTQFGSTYIFGGVNTQTAPYTEAVTGEIKYNGTVSTDPSCQRNVEISPGVIVPMNVAGDAVFGEYYTTPPVPPATTPVDNGKGLIMTLSKLSQELKNTPPVMDNIRSKITDLTTDMNTLLNVQAQVGGVSSRLTMTKNALQDNSISLTAFKNNAEGIDLAKAISDYKFQETALQSSLSVSAKSIQSSLLDYM